MTERIVVIGADAAGMSAASQAKRIAGDTVEIVAFERGAHASYSACGIPYWVAGDVDERERLIARSPDAHRRNGIDLRMRTEVEEIDLAAGRVAVHDLPAGRSYREGFDSLVIATGAVPVRPPLPGVDAAGVFGVQTLDDGTALLADLDRAQPRQAVVVGGGYIGVEMAEALVRHGIAVTVVDQAAQPMATLDPDMGTAVHRAMEGIGIDVHTDTTVTGFETGSDRRVRAVLTARGSIPADVVVLGLGVRPNTALAHDAGLPLGDHGSRRCGIRSSWRRDGPPRQCARGEPADASDPPPNAARHVSRRHGGRSCHRRAELSSSSDAELGKYPVNMRPDGARRCICTSATNRSRARSWPGQAAHPVRDN